MAASFLSDAELASPLAAYLLDAKLRKEDERLATKGTKGRLTYRARRAASDPRKASDGSALRTLFARAPSVPIRRPKKWAEVKAAPRTSVQVMYDDEHLHFLFDCEKMLPAAGLPALGSWAEDHKVPKADQTVLQDDRVEVFIWPDRRDTSTAPVTKGDGPYFAFECNRSGHSLRTRVKFFRDLDFSFGGKYVARAVPEGEGGDRHLLLLSVATGAGGEDAVDLGGAATLRLGMYRGRRMDDTGADFAWASWQDTQDATVDFHRPESFGTLELVA